MVIFIFREYFSSGIPDGMREGLSQTVFKMHVAFWIFNENFIIIIVIFCAKPL